MSVDIEKTDISVAKGIIVRGVLTPILRASPYDFSYEMGTVTHEGTVYPTLIVWVHLGNKTMADRKELFLALTSAYLEADSSIRTIALDLRSVG